MKKPIFYSKKVDDLEFKVYQAMETLNCHLDTISDTIKKIRGKHGIFKRKTFVCDSHHDGDFSNPIQAWAN